MAASPARNIRIPEDVWAAAKARAEAEGVTLSRRIVEFLRWYAAGPK